MKKLICIMSIILILFVGCDNNFITQNNFSNESESKNEISDDFL